MTTERQEYIKQWRARNRDKVRAARKRYYDKNRDRLRAEARAKNEGRREYRTAWYQRNKPRLQSIGRARNLLKKYGLTIEAWEGLFDAQGRICAICGGDEPGGLGWSTDHSHATGQVRGILCNSCNLMLGLIGERVEVLRAAIAYLEQHEAVEAVEA